MSNNSRTSFSESPLYFEVRVAEDTLKKVVRHSVATARASNVLPVPGGPVSRTPFQGRRMPFTNEGIIQKNLKLLVL